jgi:hypothetical protein
MSFFIDVLLTRPLCDDRRGALCHHGVLLADGLIDERAGEAAADRSEHVDPELAPLGGAADEGLDEVRSELAGRVEGGAGDRADEDDDPVDDEADDDAGETGGRAAVDGRPEDREDEDRGADDLGEEADVRSAFTATAPSPSFAGSLPMRMM